MTDERSRDRIQSIERGIEVLLAFGGHDAALSVAAIAGQVGLSRPVVRRILLTFEHLGYAESTGGVWRLTPRILELSAGYFAASSLPEISYRYLSDAVGRTGETCSIGVLDGRHVMHVARVEDRRPLPDAVRIGQRLPAHATALGKVLLADLDDAELDTHLAEEPLEPHTPRTLTDPAALRERIAQVRTRGYDVSLEELHPGMLAVAVPIVVDGSTVGALSASSTTVRETEESLVGVVLPILTQTAADIARAYRNANPQVFRNGSRARRVAPGAAS
ncbi:IclR family transcriptional regulator domain-containing protein [Microbacterium marinilacus]|uniref:IclR family transcriptional regulator C-terminal domain-containing protein n=1 Tax=Microbacterium marinilacus TaxID=415209 RepID=A0ABP7B2S9_9MICO|nr:IclR family transcriptional regulator C-terminal domain-containing protein [Microbacterium marinilacus]MBY0688602.1 helix-turn-helix domain-containing protein [Microbacterium marinilacus]